MTGVTLNANDAAELAEMLQFLADWLAHDPSRLGASLDDFAGHLPTTPSSCARTWTGSFSYSAAATAGGYDRLVVSGFHHVTLNVTDLPRARKFYEGVLGF
jgi:Glyoxalase/Bleomycin resistance protein/Dioxygenase superfamily